MIGLINETNFFVVIIALLIISFLLGLIIGKISSLRACHSSKHKCTNNTPNNSNEQPQQTNPSNQNCNQKVNTPYNQGQYQNNPWSRYYYW